MSGGDLRHGVHLGITGTRQALSESQRIWVHDTMYELRESLGKVGVGLQGPGRWQAGSEIIYWHHGDCVGADEFSHHVAVELSWAIVIHPPHDSKYRAYCRGAYMIAEEKGYLSRNRDIVESITPGDPGGLGGTTGGVLLSVPAKPITYDSARGFNGRGISGTSYTTVRALAEGKEVRVCPVTP